MEKFFKPLRQILGVGQPQSEQPRPDEEQSQASGGTAQPRTEKGQTTGSSEPNSQQAGHEKDPARGKGSETTKRWNPEQGCLEVETKQVLEPSLRVVMIQLTEGKICIETDEEVQRPELTITERVYADSEPEAINYQKDSFVGVNADWNSLLVIGKNSLGVVSGGSGNVPTAGESSQSAPRRETQVVLKVPVAENVNEGETSKPESERAYFIKVDFGDIRVKNAAGKYDISLNTGNIEVTDGRFIGKNTVRTESGNILVGFGEDQGEIEVQTILGGRVIKETIYFEGVENPNGQTAKLSLSTQDGEIKVISK